MRLFFRTVVKSQNWHLWFFGPPWVSKCLFRLLFMLNALSHWEQLKGFSPVCLREWTVNSEAERNALLQLSHIKLLLPVWVMRCDLRAALVGNNFPHSGHALNPSLVWIRPCRLSELNVGYNFSQCVHSKVLLSVWIFLVWVVKQNLDLNVLGQMVHGNSLALEWTNPCFIKPLLNLRPS